MKLTYAPSHPRTMADSRRKAVAAAMRDHSGDDSSELKASLILVLCSRAR
ncbi:hypothetical protein OROMI_015077 [Orobanche minor]